MAFCDSRAVDETGAVLWPDHQGYYAAAGDHALLRDGIFSARSFARRFLAERNLVPNASAVLWRRSALLRALARCGPELERWRVAGDWRIYAELLSGSDGTVGYVAAPLNAHRRHAASTTRSLAAVDHLDEIARMHALLRERLDLDPAEVARQEGYLETVAATLGVRRRDGSGG
jgi:hypothetical protein